MKNFKYLIVSYNSFWYYEAYDQTGPRPDIAKTYNKCSKSWRELDENLKNGLSFNEYVTTMIDEHYDLIVLCNNGLIDILKFYEEDEE